MKKPTKKNKLSNSTMAHDHSSELKRLNRIKGQVTGVDKMIRDKRYCPEIIIQIKAIRSALKALEANIMEGHIRHCVLTAVKSRNEVVINKKIDEVLTLIKGQN